MTRREQELARQFQGVSMLHRLGWGIGAPMITLALIGLPIVLAWSELPDPMNISWDEAGEPKNPVNPSRFLGLQLTFWSFCTVGFLVGSFGRFRKPRTGAMMIIAAVVVSVSFAVISVSTVVANRKIASWADVPSPGFVSILLGIVLPLLAAALTVLALRETLIPTPEFDDASPSAGITLRDSATAAWHGECTAFWPRAFGVVGLAVAVVLMLIGPWLAGSATVAGLSVLAVALMALAFSRIQVSVDRRGLTVRYGYLPWPSTRIPMDTIESAGVIQVVPMDYGGWGYRGSRTVLGAAAVVIRRGEGIHLQLRSGKQFVVTVEEAAQGAGVLNDLRMASGATT